MIAQLVEFERTHTDTLIRLRIDKETFQREKTDKEVLNVDYTNNMVEMQTL